MIETDKSRERRQIADPVLLLVRLMALIAVGAFLYGWRTNAETESWPTTTGTMVESRVEWFTSHSNRTPRTMYWPVVRYVYQVDGRQYEGNQIAVTGVGSVSVPSWVEAMIEDYPSDASVTVFYDPKDPANACLSSRTPLVFLAFGGVGALLFLWSFVRLPPWVVAWVGASLERLPGDLGKWGVHAA